MRYSLRAAREYRPERPPRLSHDRWPDDAASSAVARRRVSAGRRGDRLLHRLGEQLARLRAVVVADLHHRARLGQDRDEAVEQRLGGHRLAQIFVDAEPHRLDHAPALDMGAEHDDRDVRHRKHAGRAHDAHEFGAVEQRHLPVEDHDIGREHADGFEPGDAVARLVDVPDADIDQEIAHDLAHVRVVVDHQHAERLDELLDALFDMKSSRSTRPIGGTSGSPSAHSSMPRESRVKPIGTIFRNSSSCARQKH